MGGARPSEFRQYWVRYILAFWAVEKLQWARDKVLIAFVCSLAPGLITAGISAALSDHKWRVAAYATLLTYAGLFALFLTWRLASTPFELDQERQEFITGLSKSLMYTRSKLAALQAQPPAIDAEILELHVQAETSPVARVPYAPVDCDIFLRVKLRLRESRPIEVLAYEFIRSRRYRVSENSFSLFCHWLYRLLGQNGKSLASKSAITPSRCSRMILLA